jgi:hypothetical protein
MGSNTAKGGTATLAKTGLDATLVPFAVVLVIAGLLLLRRRQTS